jgi:AcrR family transcriptional regulator
VLLSSFRSMSTAPRRRPYAPRVPPGQRREQLLDAALTLIGEHGYRGASMEAIARQASVAKPVVYRTFTSREALLMALLERERERAFATLEQVLPTDLASTTPDALLTDGARAILAAVQSRPEAWRLILMPAGETPAVVREQVEQGRAIVRGQVTQLIQWGLEMRPGLPDVDPELTARLFMAAGEEAMRLVLTEPDAYTPDDFAAFAAKLLSAVG